MKEITEEEAREVRWYHWIMPVVMLGILCFVIHGCCSDMNELASLRKEVVELREQVHGYKLKETK